MTKFTKMIEDLLPEINTIISRYRTKESSILGVLNFIQDKKGFISTEAEREVSEILNVPPAKVHEVASFYTMFFLNPKGKYLIQVCRSISCSILNSESIIDYIQDKLKININQTTTDKKFTLISVECLGSCGKAPAMRINDKYYENLTIEKVNEILSELR